MPERKMLSQEEIDALLSNSDENDDREYHGQGEGSLHNAANSSIISCDPGLALSQAEKDALGEIGNISMGAAATALSELLRQKVVITSPRVSTCTQEDLFLSFSVPYIIIQVEFTTGLKGFNLLIIQTRDAALIADLMMGGEGKSGVDRLSDLELSAASEAMNQMIGTASTSLSTMFGHPIIISPPQTHVLEVTDGAKSFRLPTEDQIVVVSFKMKIGSLLDTKIMQVMSIHTAKEEATLLLGQLTENETENNEGERETEKPILQQKQLFSQLPTTGIAQEEVGEQVITGDADTKKILREQTLFQEHSFISPDQQRRLDLLLDIPLQVSVILGRTKRPLKEVLNMTPGSIVELSSQVGEPIDILVNGTLIARGDVVAVNENFGVRVTSIISPQDRIQQMGKLNHVKR